MRGTPKKNLSMFEALCGVDALRNVVLTTTMWDKADEDTRVKHEKQLRSEFWEPMLSLGCRMERFYSTWESAWAIIDNFSVDTRRPIQIQKERVDQGKGLNQTAAFAALFQWWDRFTTRLRRRRPRRVPRNNSAGSVTAAVEEHSLLRRQFGIARNPAPDIEDQSGRSNSSTLVNVARPSGEV